MVALAGEYLLTGHYHKLCSDTAIPLIYCVNYRFQKTVPILTNAAYI